MSLPNAVVPALLVLALALVGCGGEPAPEPADGFALPDVDAAPGVGTTGGVVTSKRGVFTLTVTPSPSPIPLNESFAIEVDVARAETPDVLESDATLQLTARMPEHNHGMLRYPVTERVEPGRFRASGMLFHMTGFWELVVNVQAGDDMDQATMRIDLE